MTDLEEARSFFINDKFAMITTGIDILEVKDKYAKCILNIEEKHLNVAGTVMGGAIFTLADFTYAVASNFRQGHAVSVGININFLRPAKGKYLISESNIVKDGRTIINYDILIKDDQGKLVATANVTGMRVPS